ncbi:O-antigen ligase family protein [Polluticoccus soli]|uniref:O-antigen ligase family protein n=1 Tax=Polluticoccus soli TaxID=3034150 RepID=UPI0023E32C70|nr:O-antigen ligase family protein [Flavipsychrobacter sp. JY13-12]
MQPQGIQLNKWEKGIGIGILLMLVALASFLSEPLLLVTPFVFLFVLMTGLNWKLAFWFLLFSIPGSIELNFLGDTLSTSVPDEPIMWLLLLVFMILWAKQPNILPAWWWKNPIVMIVVLQYLWMIVCVIYSKETMLSVKFMAAKTWFLVSFFVLPVFIFKEKKDFKKAFIVLLVPLFITMVIILIRHAMLGFSFRKIEKAISEIYTNHVDYSTILSMVFCLLWIAFPLTRGTTWLMRLTVLFLIIFFLPVLYLTFARAAMVAVVFAIGISIMVRLRLVNIVMPLFYGCLAVLMVFVVRDNHFLNFRPNFQKTFMHNKFEDHIIATIQGRDMSSMERVYRWIAAVRMSKEEPVTGYGPNAFYYYYKPYAVSSFKTYVSRNDEHSTTHNYYLYMLVEQGYPGMILYAIFVVVVFAVGQRTYHRFKDRFYKKVTLGLIMMFAAGFINNFFSELLESHKVGTVFYLGIALLVILDHKSRQLEQGIDEEQAVIKP